MINDFGVDKGIIDEKVNKFMPYANKIPFVGNYIKAQYDQVMEGVSSRAPQKAEPVKDEPVAGFDRNKYRKI